MNPEPETLRVERVVYGGYGLARLGDSGGVTALIPFSLPGELILAAPAGKDWQLLDVLQASPQRTAPGCPHFGVCGGCHLQMASYPEQLHLKREVLRESLMRASVTDTPEIVTHSAEPWGYRNRIRLHVVMLDGSLRLGYRKRKTHDLLPIVTCPIAAPLLWRAAEALLSLAARDGEFHAWLASSSEVELFCDGDESRLQITLHFTAPPSQRGSSFSSAMSALKAILTELTAAGAVLVGARTGRITETLAGWGAEGLSYSVHTPAREERYWIARGGFFQVNRFLLDRLVELVCADRSGTLAWDLFAGVGLFARVLARRFDHVTAVEANPTAARELATALQRLGAHVGEQATTIAFLRSRILQRERPDLIVLDPPRAGAGAEVCALLAQFAPHEIVYVSCDPTTLARDLAQLIGSGYRVDALHLVDLFPQTYHQEAVVILRRDS